MFDIIEPFADYSFNKSHSVGYGFVAYQTAYLKANHPREYLAALLTSVKGDKDKSAVYLNECRQLEIPVLVPDVNESEMDFAVVYPVDASGEPGAGAIRFGLSAVRNVGEGVVAKIIEARDEGGPFIDFYDFCERVETTALNKRTIESLVKAGAFDSLGHPRQGLGLVFEPSSKKSCGGGAEKPKVSSTCSRRAPSLPSRNVTTVGRRSRSRSSPRPQRLAFEKEMLGLYVSDHPLMGAERALRRHTDATLSDLKEMREGELRTVGGVVTALAKKYTKRGDLDGHLRPRRPRRGRRGDGLPEDDGPVRRAPRRGRDRLHQGVGSTCATTRPRSSRWRSPNRISSSTAHRRYGSGCVPARSPTRRPHA